MPKEFEKTGNKYNQPCIGTTGRWAMTKIKIVVHVAGEELEWDKIPEERQRLIAEKIQEAMMSSAGYKRSSMSHVFPAKPTKKA